MNKELLLDIADAIERNPAYYRQQYWASVIPGIIPEKTINPDDVMSLAGESPTECGTACCIAGWAVALMPKEEVAAVVSSIGTNDFEHVAGRLLEIDDVAPHAINGIFSANMNLLAYREYKYVVDEEALIAFMRANPGEPVRYSKFEERVIKNDTRYAKPATVAAMLRRIAVGDEEGLKLLANESGNYRKCWMRTYEDGVSC